MTYATEYHLLAIRNSGSIGFMDNDIHILRILRVVSFKVWTNPKLHPWFCVNQFILLNHAHTRTKLNETLTNYKLHFVIPLEACFIPLLLDQNPLKLDAICCSFAIAPTLYLLLSLFVLPLLPRSYRTRLLTHSFFPNGPPNKCYSTVTKNKYWTEIKPIKNIGIKFCELSKINSL